MEYLTHHSFFIILPAVILGAIAIWAPRKVWIKTLAVFVTLVFAATTFYSVSDFLSRPKPSSLEIARQNIPRAKVLGFHLREREGIYLWLLTPDSDIPGYYKFPWDRKLAEELVRADREAKQAQRGLFMRKPFQWFEKSLEPEGKFYPEPQEALPPKDLMPGKPFEFVPPRQEKKI